MFSSKISKLIEKRDGLLYVLKKKVFGLVELDILNEDSIHLKEAKRIIKIIEETHPYFLSSKYDQSEYNSHKKAFVEVIKNNSNFENLPFHVLRYFKVLCDGHMSMIYKYTKYLEKTLSVKKNNLVFLDNSIQVYTIGKKSVNEILEELDKHFYYENTSNRLLIFHEYIHRMDFLSYIGCDIKDNKVVLSTNDGDLSFSFKSESIPEIKFDKIIENAADSSRIIYINSDNFEENHTFIDLIKEYLTNESSKLIIDLREYRGGSSIFYEKFLDELSVSDTDFGYIDRLSNTLRNKKPNSYFFARIDEENVMFTYKLPKANYRDYSRKIFVLTSIMTYSSGVQFATILQDCGLGIVLGEIPGNSPCSFGDILGFDSAPYNFGFCVSHKCFIRPNSSKSRTELIPDIIIQSKNALQYAINLLNGNMKGD
jgi:hypothetical protein